MTFIVTFIALLIERFFDWSHLRHWQWFQKLKERLVVRFKTISPFLQLTICIAPILLLALIITLLIKDWMYGLISLLFQLIVLLYCFGPKNLWAGMFAQINIFKEPKKFFTSQGTNIEIPLEEKNSEFQQQFFNNIFIDANRKVFAVLCWYILLGPIGALFYRTISLTANNDTPAQLSHVARIIEGVLDWVPVRIFTFLFALGGHFAQVLTFWRKYVLMGLSKNEILLTECGTAALGSEVINMQSRSAKRSAISLLDRVFIIWLVIIAVGALLI